MLFCIKTSFLAKKRFIEYKDTRTSLKSFHLLPPQKAHCATKIEITQLLDFIRDLGFLRGPQAHSLLPPMPPCYPTPRKHTVKKQKLKFFSFRIS